MVSRGPAFCIQSVLGVVAGILLPLLVSFQCVAQTIPASGTNLPLILLTTDGNVAVPMEELPTAGGTMQIINNGPVARNRLTDAVNDYNGRIQIGVRGESSAFYPQTPYAITTVTASGANNNVPVLGLPADNDWVLISLYNDRSFIRNLLAYKMSAEMGHYTSRSMLCEVMLNGNYEGVYLFGEKIKQGDNRVDIAKLKTTDTAGDDLTGGYIFRFDVPEGGYWLSPYHPIDHPYLDVFPLFDYPSAANIRGVQSDYLQAYTDSFEAALYSSHFADTTTGYRKYSDPVTFIDYALVNEVARNIDGFKKSYYFYKDKDSHDPRIKNGPVWDFDWAFKNVTGEGIFGDTTGVGWAYKINDYYQTIDVNSPGWMVRLMQDCPFSQTFQDRYFSFRGSALKLAYLNSFIDSMTTVLEIDSAAARHFAKWGTLGVPGPTPEVGVLPTTFAGEMANLKSWLATRISWLDSNMPACTTPTPEAVAGAGNGETTVGAIYPVPAGDVLYFRLNAVRAGIYSFMIYDGQGRVLRSFSRAVTNGTQQLSFDVHDLPAGQLLLLRVSSGDTEQAYRFTRL